MLECEACSDLPQLFFGIFINSWVNKSSEQRSKRVCLSWRVLTFL